MEQLEKTRLARVELEAQIDALEGEYRLVEAQGAGPALQINETKLTQARTLLADLRTRLDVARRVMATEAKFVELIPVEAVEADSLVERIDAHFKDQAVAGF